MEFLSDHLTTALAVVALGVLSVGGIALSEHEIADVPPAEDAVTQDVVAEDAGPPEGVPPEHAGTDDDVRPEDAGPPSGTPPAHANAPGQGHGAAVSDFARTNNPSHGEISGCEFGRAVAAMASQGRSEQDPDREVCPDEE